MTTPVRDGTPPTTPGARVRDLARTQGAAPALRELLGPPDPAVPPHAPHGFAVLPQEHAELAGYAGRSVEALRTYALPGGPLTLVRVDRVGPGDRCAPPFDAAALLWLRLGLAEALRRACVEHLRDRPSGDSTVLLQPLVKAQLAEATAAQLELAAWLGEGAADDVPAARLRGPHAQVTENGRALLRLFGAHGFLADGPGGVAHLSELLADVHQDTEGAR
ncbi:hypothetical protein ABT001_07710 [Streptomyces sp. NPDC002793]|uniref:hypothetical protein n=1 Tax=Streptomyces sp. NPDC002793 TaxID=3154432 RepID=UPI00331CA956